MNEELLRALFKIPDPITVDEFSRRTGKTESAVRKLVERRLTGLDLSNTGRLIYTIGSELQRYTIIAGLQDKYLITPHPIRESEILTNLRLIERSQVAFIDDAQCTVFNA